jgi:hypothetical protein
MVLGTLCWKVVKTKQKHGVCLCWICACSGCRDMLTPLMCWLFLRCAVHLCMQGGVPKHISD